MIGSRRLWARALLTVAAISVSSLCSGCVYLRLLELKRQLAQFERNFALQTDEGIRIICHHPLLLADDVRWIGMRPETIKKLGRAELWHVRWVKQLPPGVTEKGTFSIELDLTFADGKLSAVTIPENYFKLLPKSFVIGVIKSVGGAKVDKSARTAESVVTSGEVALAQPSMPSIEKILGRATESRVDGPHTIDRYRYIPATKEPRPGVFEMTLRFHTTSGTLLHWHGRTPIGNIAFDFAQ
ncbi:MAG TPA: hypothetical protein VM029_18815 [Opitutaceae bacterium]|nr:hypothetical protein [Opitutaceae bacterium]